MKKSKSSIINSDNEFYRKIWGARPHICSECGVSLGSTISKYYMAHIWSKGSNANAFRWDERNIILLCPDHHNELDCGDKTSMSIYPIVEETIIKLKREYHESNKPIYNNGFKSL